MVCVLSPRTATDHYKFFCSFVPHLYAFPGYAVPIVWASSSKAGAYITGFHKRVTRRLLSEQSYVVQLASQSAAADLLIPGIDRASSTLAQAQ